MIRDAATVLITAPMKKGDPTEYTAVWAEQAIKIAKDLGYNVITIKGSETTHDNVNDAIKRYKPNMVTHFGHGCQLSLQGQNECIISRKYSIDEMICMAESPNLEDRQKLLGFLNPLGKLSCPGICSLDSDPCSPFCLYPTNIDLLRGSIVMAVACHSAEQLGKCAVNYGVNSYIGYNDLLMFPVDSMNSQDMFGEIQLTLFKELLMGKTSQEAKETTEKLEDTYIRKYKKVKYVALPMLWNKIHRRVLGNPRTMIYQY